MTINSAIAHATITKLFIFRALKHTAKIGLSLRDIFIQHSIYDILFCDTLFKEKDWTNF
ncbi:MAG TPA: hypothetical protein PKY82_29665 [Pyrinomonadaceae bacterium]|nr:hypothetical protein [Pyrinomonadaceae bacterium]